MLLRYPVYFEKFRCIAAACSDSCCKEWDVAVDRQSAEVYRSMEGPLGEELRRHLYEEDDEWYFAITDGRCPMWRADGLCRIQAELGHDALCKTCREFPRLTHDYGDFVEYGLELSCPEAARMILSAPEGWMEREVSGGELSEYDAEAMEILLRTREEVLALLRQERPAGELLSLLLLYGYHAQGELDGGESFLFAPEKALETAKKIAREGDLEAVLYFYKELEILSPTWLERLEHPNPGAWSPATGKLARYFVERYWLQAVSDYDLVGRVKLAVISCLVIHALGGDFAQTAQAYSKEIENDADNVGALLDGAYEAPAFTDEKILSLLLEI